MLPKSTPEQRKRFYTDIEELVNVGFLSQKISVGRNTLSFRSLCPGDLAVLNHRIGNEQSWDLWAAATSLWMFNGVSLLEQPQAIPALHALLERLPRSVRDRIIHIVLGLYTRQTRAGDGAEAYCYESSSRMQWRLLGKHNFKHNLGIPGIERLGLNYAQQIWAAFNELEDIKQQDEQMWEGFKLVAMVQAPKGIKQLDQHDKQRRELEETRRQQVADQFFWQRLGIVSQDGQDLTGGMFVKMPVTEEDLREEMRKWVAGEHDEHDRIVEDYKRSVTEKHMADKRMQDERMLALRQMTALENKSTIERPLVGYTAEQLGAILSQRNAGRPAGARTIYEGEKDREYLYQKYLEEKPAAGRLQIQNGQLATDEESKTLSQKVAERLVTYKNQPGEE